MADKNDIALLLVHPTEPVFLDKNGKFFDVPEAYLTERYKHIMKDVIKNLSERPIEERIPITKFEVPDLEAIQQLTRNQQLSLFIPRHRHIAGRLIDIFMYPKTLDELQSVAVYARDRVNPLLFNYALSVALLHRPDTKGVDLPSFIQSFPDFFMDSRVLTQLREELTVVPEGSRMPVVIPHDYTSSDSEPEHRLWYFREDLGINLHHWHWHLVYPFEAPRFIANKDRRGELFYYMHQQIVARYNMERFSHNMERAIPFSNLREPIGQGYFPKMTSLVSSRAWPPRSKESRFVDLRRDRDEIHLDVEVLELWRDRIYEAIHQGYAVNTKGKQIPLDEENGINVLGNLIESSVLSPNRDFYGDVHNMGHVFISFSHDPEHRHLEGFGLMSEAATAMRDPVFYRWHAYVDIMFQEFISRLTPYTEKQLSFDGVTVIGFKVSTEHGTPNILNTFWQESDIDVSSGLDFMSRGSAFARFKHLQHTPFTYTINVVNDGDVQRQGYVRIFMGPKTDERGNSMSFGEQRLMMVELDKFVATLNPGENTIRRRSTESSVTIPFERTFRDLNMSPAFGTPAGAEFVFCGCGWPNHMLIPKGMTEGLQCELFVMVSNYEEDKVEQDLIGSCSDAASYCGVRDRRYPDKRHMGYPFDHLPRTGAETLEKFLTPNMSVVNVVIRHENITVRRPPF